MAGHLVRLVQFRDGWFFGLPQKFVRTNDFRECVQKGSQCFGCVSNQKGFCGCILPWPLGFIMMFHLIVVAHGINFDGVLLRSLAGFAPRIFVRHGPKWISVNLDFFLLFLHSNVCVQDYYCGCWNVLGDLSNYKPSKDRLQLLLTNRIWQTSLFECACEHIRTCDYVCIHSQLYLRAITCASHSCVCEICSASWINKREKLTFMIGEWSRYRRYLQRIYIT